jgi:hypothetical protein
MVPTLKVSGICMVCIFYLPVLLSCPELVSPCQSMSPEASLVNTILRLSKFIPIPSYTGCSVWILVFPLSVRKGRVVVPYRICINLSLISFTIVVRLPDLHRFLPTSLLRHPLPVHRYKVINHNQSHSCDAETVREVGEGIVRYHRV